MQKANKYSKVISIKFDTKENGSYTNPFMPRAIDWLKLDIDAYKQYKEDKFSLIQNIKPPPEKKEKEFNIQSVKFHTADKDQEDGIKFFNKPTTQKLGGKCMNFMFRCNL